jgi:hypothetical protein
VIAVLLIALLCVAIPAVACWAYARAIEPNYQRELRRTNRAIARHTVAR